MSNVKSTNKKMQFELIWEGNRHPQESFKVDTIEELRAVVRAYCKGMKEHCIYNEVAPVMLSSHCNELGYISLIDREDMPAPFYCDAECPVDIPDRLSGFLKWWDGAPNIGDIPEDVDIWWDVFLEYIDD